MTKLDRITPPPVRDYDRLSLPPCNVRRLDNGITINTIQTGTLPVNRISVIWNYGFNRCHGSISASITPTMMMQGTTSLTGAEIVDRTDFLGAFLSQVSNESYSGFQFLCLTEFTAEMFDLLGDIIVNPTFPGDRFEAIKRKTIADYELKQANTHSRASELLNTLLWGPEHPYMRAPGLDELKAMERSNIVEAWRVGTTTTDIHIFVSGNITPDVSAAIDKFAQTIRPQAVTTTDAPNVQAQPVTPCRRIISMPDSKQSSIAIGIPAIARTHADYVPLRIAVTALGGYFGSRLMTSIREEKGLTYGISAVLMGSQYNGAIKIAADCDSSYVNDVIDAVNAEIKKLADEPMDAAELSRLKSYYMTTVAATLESFKSIGEYYENRLTIGLHPDYFNIQQTVLQQLTSADICRLTRQYIDPEKARIVIASPDAAV